MDAESMLLGAEQAARFVTQRQVPPAAAVDDEFAPAAQFPRDDVHQTDLPAMRIEQQHFLQAGARHALAQLGPVSEDRARRERQRAVETDMLGAVADLLRRQQQHRQVARQARKRAAMMPSTRTWSTDSGRWGPCCSVAPSGSTATVRAGSSAANSRVLRSAQKRDLVICAC